MCLHPKSIYTILNEVMKTEKIKNGSLYWNINTECVERVVGKLNSTRVFTVGHKYSNLKPVKASHLLLASNIQVSDYLTESKEVARVLPPLPTLPRVMTPA